MNTLELTYKTTPSTLHIALSTFPQGFGQEDYIEDVNEIFIKAKSQLLQNLEGNKTRNQKKIANYYRPLKFYLLGGYDICFLDITASYKFSTKLFDNYSSKNIGFQHSFQLITGNTPIIDEAFKLEDYFLKNDLSLKPFLGISNLKISNPLLIGNGHKLYDNILKKIKEIGESLDLKFIILQAYSWFEITVLIFAEKIEEISYFVTNLRGLQLDQINNKEEIAKNSLYDKLKPDNSSSKDLHSAHIFSDSHTYIGINYNVINYKEYTKNQKKWNKIEKNHKITNQKINFTERTQNLKKVYESIISHQFTSKIEFQIKPGHWIQLKKEIQEHPILKEVLAPEKSNFIIGKTDYDVPFKSEQGTIENNIKILNWLSKLSTSNSSKNDNLKGKSGFDNFRKIKTRPYFKYRERLDGINSLPITDTGFQRGLEKLVKKANSKNIDENLKKLKVSRTIREKVLKVFYLYNLGITDPVLFTYFLDFKPFIEFLIFEINNLVEVPKNNSLNLIEKQRKSTVKDIEERLSNFISVFDSGFFLRFYNSYFTDDLGDNIDIDFNSSIQGLLTTYSSIVTNLSQIIYSTKDENIRGFDNPAVVQINLQNTVGGIISLNYAIPHLINVEFFAFTIIKEILNPLPYISEIRKLEESFILPSIKLLSKESPLIEAMHKGGNIDLDYLLFDMYRLVFTCNFNLELFEWSFWTYNLQNPSLFTKSGSMNINNFQLELFRLMYIVTSLNESYLDEMECPIPELQTHWEHFYYIFKKILINRENAESIKKGFREILNSSIALDLERIKIKNCGDPVNSKFKDIKARFKLENIGNNDILCKFYDYNELFYERFFENKNEFNGVFYDRKEDNPQQFTLALLHGYLRFIYNKNGQKVRVLPRNWDTGNPLKSFITNRTDEDFIYYSDTLGGIFFTKIEQAEQYFQHRSAMLQSLIHLSLIIKKDYFN